ncbi:MAG TPA: hypothetical protein VMV86_04195, partial [Methanosarcinales archaeon]|nr:hypothetical protein [Methanosarcinales archaeon]
MSPPKIACQVQASLLNTLGGLIEKVEAISLNVQSVINTLVKIKYGIINFADLASAEIVSTISAVASSAAQVALGAISKASAAFLEAMLSALLKILLSFPTAIFSLVAIPQEQATDAAKKERLYLLNAKTNIRRVVSIIAKWTDGFGGDRYYKQMKEAMPFIENAIKIFNEVITELEGSPTESDKELNSRFNKRKYETAKNNLLKAIEITKPSSVIIDNSHITQIIERKQRESYNDNAKKINTKYAIKRSNLTEWYHEEINKNSPHNKDKWPERLSDSINLEGIRQQYASRLKVLETSKKEELAAAELASSTQGILDKSAYIEAAQGIAASFRNDMQVLSNELFQFLENIKDAFLQYKRCQSLCNVIYNIEGKIKSLIGEIIKLLRETGNGASDVIIEVLDTSIAMISFTKDKFDNNISKYEDVSKGVSASIMSTTVAIGHGALRSADSALSASVTDSLIKLINEDDVLEDSNGRFQEFIGKLAEISDWDGEIGVWAVDQLNASISPYPKLVSDSTALLAKVSKLAFSTDQEDRIKMRFAITTISKIFKELTLHNSEVYSVLTSY